MLLTKIFQATLKSPLPLTRTLLFKNTFHIATTKPKTCYYKVLNVSTDATLDEIKNSYRELAKKFHPDVTTGETVQEGKFLEISEAYQILSDQQKRQQYDHDNGFAAKFKRKGGPKSEGNKTAHFGDFGFTQENPPTEKEKEELDNYFQKKYFKNKDYFKFKHDEDSPWNLTRKLYNQTMDNKERAKEEHVLFDIGTEPYFASREELKYDKDRHLYMGLLYDYRYLIVGSIVIIGGIVIAETFFNNKDETKSTKGAKLAKMA